MLENQKIDSSKGKLQHLAFTRLSYSDRFSFGIIICFNNISAFIESHPSRSFELTAFEVVVCIVNPALLLNIVGGILVKYMVPRQILYISICFYDSFLK